MFQEYIADISEISKYKTCKKRVMYILEVSPRVYELVPTPNPTREELSYAFNVVESGIIKSL